MKQNLLPQQLHTKIVCSHRTNNHQPMKKIFFATFLLSMVLNAQNKIFNGFVKDAASQAEIGYVNIGIVNKNNGTVTATNGSFSMNLDNIDDVETIKISSIGYQPIVFDVSTFKKICAENNIFYLKKNTMELKEVVIKNKKLQTATLGNFLGKKTVSAGFVNNVLGNEIGIVVKIKHKPTFIEAFHAVVDYNKFGAFKFRINVYNLKKGLPNENILTENIIASTEIKKGVLTVNLSDYNLVVNENFFISMELIEQMGEGGLHFLANYNGTPIITRSASQGKWNKQDDLSFGFSVTVKN